MKIQADRRSLRIARALCLLLLSVNCNSSVGGSNANSAPTRGRSVAAAAAAADRPVPAAGQAKRKHDEKEVKLHPVDEGSKDSSFLAFREKLLEATKRRDAKFILSTLDSDILNSFGGEGGVEEFKEHWKLDRPDSEFWGEMLSVLQTGGAFMNSDDGQEFCAPYVASEWKKILSQLPDSSDEDEYAAIVGENVPLRLHPDHNSDVIDTLSYHVIKLDPQPPASDVTREAVSQWEKVITLSGKKGYVLRKDVRSPADYHACFKKVEGRWVMTMFVAGD